MKKTSLAFLLCLFALTSTVGTCVANEPAKRDVKAGHITVDAMPGPKRTNILAGRLSNDVSGHVHVVGIYESGETRGFRQHPMGAVNIIVSKKSEPVVLVLCSYEPVSWNVTLEPGATVKQIILGGYHAQTVTGPLSKEIPITVHTYEATSAWAANVRILGGYFTTYKLPDAPSEEASHMGMMPPDARAAFREHLEYERAEDEKDWRNLLHALETDSAEKTISTFQGNYKGSQFYI